MARKEKKFQNLLQPPMAKPVLVVKPKSRGRRYAAIAAWSVIVFWLYFSCRVNIGEMTNYFLSPSFQVPFGHIVDYSIGFLPRVLSGQLLTFFTGGSTTGQAAGAYFFTLFAITYGLFSLVLGMLIEKALSAKNYLMAMFPLLILFTPHAVWYRFFHPLNIDTLMFLFALAAFFLIKSEKLTWCVPVCVCLGIMASQSFMLLFFPLVFAIQYYEFIKSGMKRTRLSNLITTPVSSFALTLYMQWAVSHSELVSKYSYTEAIAYLERKAGHALVDDVSSWYFSSGVFGKLLDGRKFTLVSINAWSPFDYFKPIYYVFALLICAPILIFTLTIWRKHMKGEKGFWKKSPYILFMLAPLIIFPAFLIFVDIDRLVSSALLTQVLLIAYVFFANGQGEAFIRLKEIGTGKYRWLLYAAVLLGVIVPLMVFRSSVWLDPPFNPAALEIMAG
jgi:hypothetical protein